MNKTKIEWCDSTWNPVTGCYHTCEYCYARRIAERFKGCDTGSTYGAYHQATCRRLNPNSPLEQAIFEVDAKCPPINITFDAKKQIQKHSVAPYPWGFKPTLRRDHLTDFVNKKSRTIFVCSMADLFGEWVPDEWIEEVFAACKVAPQHRYLFLTKNPNRYADLHFKGKLPTGDNMWYGVTPTATLSRSDYFYAGAYHTFVSVEPILKECSEELEHFCDTFASWVIIGAETGNRKDKVIPQKEWVINIIKTCVESNVCLFMKDSLVPIIGEENMFRMLPWDRATWEISRQLKWLENWYKNNEVMK